ncbi:MAG: prepilin-type N-terminal cleavage/methylation domain-containing protein, partial [Proteobacteria bacterium]|nr:prepilin-type N-terminal cleavage/methylation domain-containing protein [Pseudomonadota bacterium]
MRPYHQRNGFTLVEVAIVMLIIGLLAGIVLPLAGSMMDQQRRKETANKLAAIDQALLAFVTTNKRLPCPAAGTTASGAVNAGVAQPAVAGDCTALNTGVVPWATLGLGEGDVTDAWGVRITYRVPTGAAGFTRANALDASKCDPAGAANRNLGGAGADFCVIAGCAAA